jgi:hypothetical protein
MDSNWPVLPQLAICQWQLMTVAHGGEATMICKKAVSDDWQLTDNGCMLYHPRMSSL